MIRHSIASVIFVMILLAAAGVTWATELDKGHAFIYENGLQIMPLLYHDSPPSYNVVDWGLWPDQNFTAIQCRRFPVAQIPGFFDCPGFPEGQKWSRWLSEDDKWLDPDDDMPWVDDCVALLYRDEQLSTSTLSDYIDWFAEARQRYPHVLLYTNTWTEQLTDAEYLNYMASCEPDLISFDRYPFQDVPYPPTYFYVYYQGLKRYRQLSLLGNDGTGQRPIPFGLWLQAYLSSTQHSASESEIRYNQFSLWAFGGKFAQVWCYNNVGGMSDAWTETNRQSLNLSPSLVSLISTNVGMIDGKSAAGNSTNHSAWINGAWNAAMDPYITSVSAANLGTRNNGQPGDVVVGYFKPLDESFDGDQYQDEIYFMVVNGLFDPCATVTAEDTRMMIRLDFDFGSSGITTLQRRSRETGAIEDVALVHDGGSLYHLDLILPGGTGDLFKFNTGAPFVAAPTQEEQVVKGWNTVWEENFDGATYSLDQQHDYYTDWNLNDPCDRLDVDWRRSGSYLGWEYDLLEPSTDPDANNVIADNTAFRMSFDLKMDVRTIPMYAGSLCGRIGVWDSSYTQGENQVPGPGLYFEIYYQQLYYPDVDSTWMAKAVVYDADGNSYATCPRRGLFVADSPDGLNEYDIVYHVTMTYDHGELSLTWDDTNTVYSASIPSTVRWTADAVGVSSVKKNYPNGVVLQGWLDSMKLEKPLETCGGYPFPVGDLNQDCYVNLSDIAELSSTWQQDNRP